MTGLKTLEAWLNRTYLTRSQRRYMKIVLSPVEVGERDLRIREAIELLNSSK